MIKINNYTIQNSKFPNGETKINTEDISRALQKTIALNEELVCVEYLFRGNDSLIELYLTTMAIKDMIKTEINKRALILHMAYLPYSRMDRQKRPGEFTLKYITQWINTWGYDSVHINEPHSDVSLALVDNSLNVNTSVLLTKLAMADIKFTDNDRIFYPDAGAQKRYMNLLPYKKLVGFKDRNWETGNIESYEISGDVPERPFRVIIVDDLCSFGGTFLYAAKQLKELFNVTEIYLVVAHCENSVLKGEMLESGYIDKIFTTNSIFTGDHEKIVVEPSTIFE